MARERATERRDLGVERIDAGVLAPGVAPRTG
jgi:hypothetical protein